ncbi:MAG: ClbS/DfsB family four-helix bundle protein [Prevotellaceae bacterium]|jgi:hypothetical protein|nr:ClbS/DfsB family four-helix bundle protein [Prevotellaceae bacterium]
MSRATTKTDLVIAANEGFGKLWELIDSMSDESQNATFAFEDRDKNLRDVLVHLYEWHELLLTWVKSNRQGDTRPFLPEPYNWRTYPQMNVEFWKKHQNTTLIDAKEMLKESHSKVMELIESLVNIELFAKNIFLWTGGSTLGSYCVSTTASHYDWAMKKIKKHITNE